MIALRAGFDDSCGTGLSYRSPQPPARLASPTSAGPPGSASATDSTDSSPVQADPAIFSPTGGRRSPDPLVPHQGADPDQWTLEIVNKSDEVVRRFAGRGQPPSTSSGRRTRPACRCRRHLYYRLTVKDRAGRSPLAASTPSRSHHRAGGQHSHHPVRVPIRRTPIREPWTRVSSETPPPSSEVLLGIPVSAMGEALIGLLHDRYEFAARSLSR